MPNLLLFVKKSDPILREIMPLVPDFKDSMLKQTIEDMCYSILPPQLTAAGCSHNIAAGMAANQWGIKRRIFIFTPEGSEEGKRVDVMINPSYVPYLHPGELQPTLIAAYEGCFSIPLTTGLINRYETILATYYTPQGEKIQKVLKGLEARIFQHETDHLDGKLYDGRLDNFSGPECLERIVFGDEDEMENFWNTTVRPSRKNNNDK